MSLAMALSRSCSGITLAQCSRLFPTGRPRPMRAVLSVPLETFALGPIISETDRGEIHGHHITTLGHPLREER